MPAGPHALIGRATELRRVDEFLGAIDDGPTGLLIEGEVGAGKTTLCTAGLSSARARSHRVLVSRPVETETQLAYAALGDLLAEVPDTALGELPAPQRHALEVALLRAEPEGREPLERAVALGTLGALGALARDGPTVIAIDDAQWLDAASERALGFVSRRLSDERVGLLLSRRHEDAPRTPLDVERALVTERVARLTLGPLDEADLDRLLVARLGAPLPRRTVARLHRASGGNPFFALEMARALRERGEAPASGDVLPIPTSLQALVIERLALLPPATLEAVRVAAALSRPTTAVIGEVTGGPEALEAAAAAGAVELEGERVRVVHPLLASVALSRAAPSERRALHARLAGIVGEPEERARHMALAADRPDAAVASALEEAAGRAAGRGAPGAAAELLEDARRLTPPDLQDAADRRGIAAAERQFEAGQPDRARVLLEEILDAAPPGPGRPLALARLGWVRAFGEGFRAGAEAFRAALAEPGHDAALRIEVEEGLAWCLHSTGGLAEARAHSRRAVERAEALGDPSVLAGALSHDAFLRSVAGLGIPMASIERAVRLGGPPRWPEILGRPDWIHALLLQWAGELGEARARLVALRVDAVERGDEHALPFVLFQLARVELLSGEWEAARRHARECAETTEQSGQAGREPYACVIESLVDVHLGRTNAARARIDDGLRLAERLGALPAELELLAARGFLELSLGDAAAADATLDRLAQGVEATGLREPALFRHRGDAIEAKLALGRRDEARALLDELERLGDALDRAWVRPVASRCRGLLRAALGEREAAVEALERSLALDGGQPFERARRLLALGSLRRRDKQKRAARDALEGALEIFDELGATLWAGTARAELARVGGRAPAGGLTPTEERVAELIASGLTYQEAADALFMSPKTVQWNLSKVYRKLRIRSRAELPARLAAERVDREGEGINPGGAAGS